MVAVMGYRIAIDQDECMSVGRCVADFPVGFGFDDDELAVVLPTIGELSDTQLLRAARNCPSRAIMAFDADGNQVE
jgi:ferredoxin